MMLGDFVFPPPHALMSNFEACGIREPKAETKEILLQKARRLAKQAAEMSGGADSGVREYYYGASNLNPEISPFTPERRASSTSSTPANGTQPQATPPTPKFTLNPESKAFVPPSSLANRVPTLNVEAAPFIPPSQLVAAQRTDVGATVTAEMGALSMSETDDLVGMATSILYHTDADPSLYDDLMRDFLHSLKERKASEKDLGSVAETILQQGVSSPTMCYVAARMCGSMNDELEGFRRILLKRLQKIVVEALERPEKDVTLMARFFAEIFTRVTVVKEGGYVEHFNVLRRVLMQFLERLFGSDANDSTVQTGCNILKLTGGILEGAGDTKEAQATAVVTMDQIFTRLSNLIREDSISPSTRALVTRVIQLRGVRWEHFSPKREMAAAKPVMTAEGDDGFVYFNTTGSEAPETASKGSVLGVDWSEYVDEVGNPYCDETQSASSGLEDQFDIDAEFEQFQAEEYWHYVGPSLTGEEGEEGEGGLEEEAPDQ